jgi:hypothetical protein
MPLGRSVKPATQQSDSLESSRAQARASTESSRAQARASTEGERRQNRSEDPQRALSIQLSQVREEAQLDALVLATHDGLTIAHAGDPAVCSELAAVAPLLSHGPLPTEIELPQQLLFVRAVTFEGSALYLVSCGDDPDRTTRDRVDRWLAKATVSVTRILAAA